MDGFIDEIITITVYKLLWVECTKNAALIIHTIFRPQLFDKPLKQDEPLSFRKLAGECQIADCKTCMVWDIQTSYIRVFVAQEKETS